LASIDHDTRVDVLLKEYEMAQDNRNHYENGRWLIATVFIVTSLTLFGASFLKDVTKDITGLPVILMATSSVTLLLIWKAHWDRVQPFVDESFQRLRGIEGELRNLGFTDIPRLHTNIAEETRRTCRTGKGQWIIWWMLITILSAWFMRLLLIWPCARTTVIFVAGFFLGGSMILFVCLARLFRDP
jgi:hypothetical protein